MLFLFFIADLLEMFKSAKDGMIGLDFVDDTNLIAWGPSAAENCVRLEKAHDKCAKWAGRFGAKFAPDKYRVAHFTKRRQISEDLNTTVKVGGEGAELVTSLRVLGVWLDPQLTWKDHISKSAAKGESALNAMTRLTASNWGPSVRKSKLLYTAVARPAMTYGAQV